MGWPLRRNVQVVAQAGMRMFRLNGSGVSGLHRQGIYRAVFLDGDARFFRFKPPVEEKIQGDVIASGPQNGLLHVVKRPQAVHGAAPPRAVPVVGPEPEPFRIAVMMPKIAGVILVEIQRVEQTYFGLF